MLLIVQLSATNVIMHQQHDELCKYSTFKILFPYTHCYNTQTKSKNPPVIHALLHFVQLRQERFQVQSVLAIARILRYYQSTQLDIQTHK